MKTTKVTLDIGTQIAEANELIQRQKEIGMTLLARAFAYEFGLNVPLGNKKAKKHKSSLQALYNQDAEKALKLSGQYIQCQQMVRSAMSVFSLIMIIMAITFKQTSAGTQICLSLVCGMSLIVMMSAGFEGALCRYGLDGYTVRLAKSWVKTKKVFLYYGIDLSVGESILPDTQHRLISNKSVEMEVKKATGDVPELASSLFNRIEQPIKRKLDELALANLKAQILPDLHSVKRTRNQMKELVGVAQKVQSITFSDPKNIIWSAFKMADTQMKTEITTPKDK